MRRFTIAAVLLIFPALPLFGQGAEIGFTVGWSNFTNGSIGEDESFGMEPLRYNVTNGIRIGTRMGLNTGTFIGHEFTYAWQRSDVEIQDQSAGGISIHNLYYNFLLHATPEGSVVRPFITGGGGVSVFNPPGVSSFAGYGDNKFG